MTDDGNIDGSKKKQSFLKAYLSHRESEHKRTFAPPTDTQHVEVAHRFTKPDKAPPIRRERIPIRELAMQRSRTHMRSEQQAPSPEGLPVREVSTFRRRPSPGFKLVKDGAARRSRTLSRPRKRISLYDLYAPREAPVEEVHEEPPAVETVDEEPHEEPMETGQEFWNQESFATEEHQETSPEDAKAFRNEAADILFGPRRRHRKAHVDEEAPILKEGPERDHPSREGHPSAVQEDEGVMEAGTMIQPEHDRRMEETQVTLQGQEAHEEPEVEAAPVHGHKTQYGDNCPTCGSEITTHNRLVICTDCKDQGCFTCNRYDLGHNATNVYYDYDFDFPLCIRCYEKAFAIQKQLGKAKMCFGNGNLTYALYYAQNALKLDPESKYAEKALGLIQRIDDAKKQREVHDSAWRRESKRISRARWQDPAWKKP
jgi:hypothetical protein